MRKQNFLFGVSLLSLLMFSACSSNPNPSEPSPNQAETPISLEVITVKNDAGQLSEEYQMDKNRKLKHGYEKIYYPSGKLLAQREYKMGQTEGKEISYYENGQISEEVMNQNNKRNGAFKFYHENGKIKQEGVYKDDGIEGELKVYYPTGQLKETLVFVKGDPNGPFVEYNENGSLKAKGSYITDAEGVEREQGLLELYDENGQLTSKMNCESGVCRTTWKAGKGDVSSK